MRHTLERAARDSGAKVTFVGRVDEATKWQLLRAADFGYLMSTHDEVSGAYEGFGISLLEYAAAGAVCLANGLHGTSDFANDMVTSVGGPDEAAEVSRRVLAVSADEPFLEGVVSNARNMIAGSFTWDLVAQRVLETINAD
jgi:glycosyltransferase involved in cell wall biosynthesis